MTFEAPLFIPSGKVKKDIGTLIIYACLGLVFLILIPSAIFNFPKEVQHVLNYFVYFAIPVMLITQFSLFFGFCPLNGETNGILEINDSQIIYGDKEIDFNDIVDINFIWLIWN